MPNAVYNKARKIRMSKLHIESNILAYNKNQLYLQFIKMGKHLGSHNAFYTLLIKDLYLRRA